ncbi:MAG: hypothetical protein M0Z76_10255 [Gammaproteobacteria bacterium]|nr:hypothetical protein [Gammaproteobacteria bacterium]
MRLVRALSLAVSLLASPGALGAMRMPMAGMTPVAHGVRAATRPWEVARRLWKDSVHEGRRSGTAIGFYGRHIRIVVVANAPHHPDMTFEAGGLTNPTLSITAGAQVTVTLLNMDPGPGMAHGLVITTTPPPYPVVVPDSPAADIARTRVLAPRTAARKQRARYATGHVTFRITRPGTYYYLCPVPGHAKAFHMYGRLVVTGRGRKRT